jgi:hypothetical protein
MQLFIVKGISPVTGDIPFCLLNIHRHFLFGELFLYWKNVKIWKIEICDFFWKTFQHGLFLLLDNLCMFGSIVKLAK